MKQPLMVMPALIPPAQAEALYDASLNEEEQAASDRRSLWSARDGQGDWPDEDWDDGLSAADYALPDRGRERIAQH